MRRILHKIAAALLTKPFYDVFLAGEAGYPCFRIPSLVVSTHGTVVAFGEGRGLRTGSCGDHGDVMIVSKRSTNGGKSWGDLHVVRDEFAQGASSIGNPAPVVLGDGTVAAIDGKIVRVLGAVDVRSRAGAGARVRLM